MIGKARSVVSMTMPPRPERLRRVTLAGYPQDGDKLVRWFLDGLVVGRCMLMQNRTLASARPAMTAQGGLPTFLLEALSGRHRAHCCRSDERNPFLQS